MYQKKSPYWARAICLAAVLLSVSVMISPKASWADVSVTASHRVVSVVEVGDGTVEVAFDLMLTNQGTTSVTGVSLYPIPVYFEELVPFANTLTLDAFSAGSTVSVPWTLTTFVPVSAEPNGRSLFFHGEGLDGFGELVPFSVSAEEEAVQ